MNLREWPNLLCGRRRWMVPRKVNLYVCIDLLKALHLQFWSKLHRNFPCNFPLCSPSRNEAGYVEFGNWDRPSWIEWRCAPVPTCVCVCMCTLAHLCVSAYEVARRANQHSNYFFLNIIPYASKATRNPQRQLEKDNSSREYTTIIQFFN